MAIDAPTATRHPPILASLLPPSAPPLLLLGGLTYLGRHLIPHLISAGYTLHSLAPTPAQRARLRALGCHHIFHGHPQSLPALKHAATGCIYAIHAALHFAHCDVSPDQKLVHSNVLITANLIRVCRLVGIQRLVLQSSEAVLYAGHPLCAVDETTPYPISPVGTAAQMLQLVEARVISANSPSLETVVVRPRLLWGGDDNHMLPNLVRDASAGTLRLVNGGGFLTSTCHVQNACEGMLCGLRRGRGGEVYFVTDGEAVEFGEFIEGLLTAAGVTRVVEEGVGGSVPLWVALRVAALAEMVGRRTGRTPRLTRAGVGLIGQEVTVVDEKAREELGYIGRKSVAQGLIEIRLEHLRRRAREGLGRR